MEAHTGGRLTYLGTHSRTMFHPVDAHVVSNGPATLGVRRAYKVCVLLIDHELDSRDLGRQQTSADDAREPSSDHGHTELARFVQITVDEIDPRLWVRHRLRLPICRTRCCVRLGAILSITSGRRGRQGRRCHSRNAEQEKSRTKEGCPGPDSQDRPQNHRLQRPQTNGNARYAPSHVSQAMEVYQHTLDKTPRCGAEHVSAHAENTIADIIRCGQFILTRLFTFLCSYSLTVLFFFFFASFPSLFFSLLLFFALVCHVTCLDLSCERCLLTSAGPDIDPVTFRWKPWSGPRVCALQRQPCFLALTCA